MIDINELMKVITHIQHKMKCFYYFRDSSSRNKNGSRRASAPELTRNCHNSSSSSEYTARMKKNSHDLSTSSGSAIQKSVNELYEEKGGSLRSFTYSELQQSTNGFNRLQKIGEGGFGCVYKGMIRGETGGRIGVAIKKLNQEGFQGHRQWLAEVQFLGIVAHTNLVKLVGYCATDGERGIQRLLVYEYMSNGSLENHLFSKGCELLGWERRLNIMLGAAKGLAYLHEELEVQVIFRDFKTSNVLLDDNFEAKLSDFGLAREGPSPGRSHVSTTVVGTHGYAAPDYIETGHLTSKSDVWSFGVVLYEILTGRRSLERNRPRPEQKLLEWVKKYTPDSRKFSSIMDQRLEGKYSLTSAKKIAKLADSCLAKSVKERPMMSQVVEQLKGIMEGVVGDEVVECCEEVVEQEVIGEISGGGESARRRLAQLVKIGENVDSVSRRKFMIMQRVKDKVGNNGGGGDAAKSRQNENVIVV